MNTNTVIGGYDPSGPWMNNNIIFNVAPFLKSIRSGIHEACD